MELTKKVFDIILWAILLFLSLVFVISQFHEASNKRFWIDEIYGLDYSIRSANISEMLVVGVHGQGSPAPLDYIVLKSIDAIKDNVAYFNLPPLVYFRLFSIFVTLVSFWIVLFLNYKFMRAENIYLRIGYYFLSVSAMLCYLFKNDINYFAREMRPYALWNSLFFIALGLILSKKDKWLIFVMTLMSLTATASFFQISALMAAYFIIEFFETKDFKRSFLKIFKIAIIPILLSVYYCLKAAKFGYDPSPWSEFLIFWVKKLTRALPWFIFMAFAFFKRDLREYLKVPLAFLILYLIAPFIYFLTLQKGFFFSSRQYLYYDLLNPIILFVAIRSLSAYDFTRTKKYVLPLFCVVVIAFSSLAVRSKDIRLFKKSCNNVYTVLTVGLEEVDEDKIPLDNK